MNISLVHMKTHKEFALLPLAHSPTLQHPFQKQMNNSSLERWQFQQNKVNWVWGPAGVVGALVCKKECCYLNVASVGSSFCQRGENSLQHRKPNATHHSDAGALPRQSRVQQDPRHCSLLRMVPSIHA